MGSGERQGALADVQTELLTARREGRMSALDCAGWTYNTATDIACSAWNPWVRTSWQRSFRSTCISSGGPGVLLLTQHCIHQQARVITALLLLELFSTKVDLTTTTPWLLCACVGKKMSQWSSCTHLAVPHPLPPSDPPLELLLEISSSLILPEMGYVPWLCRDMQIWVQSLQGQSLTTLARAMMGIKLDFRKQGGIHGPLVQHFK